MEDEADDDDDETSGSEVDDDDEYTLMSYNNQPFIKHSYFSSS